MYKFAVLNIAGGRERLFRCGWLIERRSHCVVCTNNEKMIENNRKYALVTGGSSGMGLEYVRQLAAKGYNVIIVALFQNETDAVAAQMQEQYPDLDFLSIGMDLSTADAARELYDKVYELRPGAMVEVLINNAGVISVVHFRSMTAEQISRIIMLHNHTTAMLCHYFIPAMAAAGKGYVLNISSLASWLSFPFISTYSATKAFIRVLTRALRTEYKKTGVRIASIYFGAVDTPLYKLSPSLRKLARCLGVMITPQKAVKLALKMLFSGLTGWMPGLFNKIAYLLTPLMRPCWIGPLERAVTRKWNLK